MGLTRYHVSIAQRNEGVVIFYMEPVADNWQLVREKNLPSWIMGLEQELSKAILKHSIP
jgi:hypothetical protein